MRTYGVQGLKAHIRNHIKLGELFHSLVKSRPDIFRVLTLPAFALTVLTVVPRPRSPSMTAASQPNPAHEAYTNDFTPDAGSQATVDANALTKEVYELVNREGEIFLTSSVIAGTYAIRVVSANPKAEEKYIRKAFEVLVQAAESLLSQSVALEPAVNGTADH